MATKKKKNPTQYKKRVFLGIGIFCIGLAGTLFTGTLGIGGSFGTYIAHTVGTYIGIAGVLTTSLSFGLVGYKLLFKKDIPITFFLGAFLALTSIPTLAAAGATLYSAETWGGTLGILFAEKMSEWFSLLSLLVLPFISLISLYLLRVIPVSTITNIQNTYHTWKEKQHEEEEPEETYEEEECEEEEYEEEEEFPEPEKPTKKHILSFSKEKEEEDIDEPPLFTHDYTPPKLSLLSNEKGGKSSAGNTKNAAQSIQRTFKTFNIPVHVEEVDIGPTVSRFAIKPAEGIRISKITGLQSNLELALAAHPIRIEAPIPGRSLVGIEIPNMKRRVVRIRSLFESDALQQTTAKLPVVIGETVTGGAFVFDIAKLPHLLVAGTTGSGKSVFIHALLMSLIYTRGPQDVRFILIDPKKVELTLYEGVPHLYTSVITDTTKAVRALLWAVNEMERRYSLLEQHKVRDIDSYNKARHIYLEEHEEEDAMPTLPHLVIVVDELADIMQVQPRELEASIVRLAQKSRAVGMHLVLSTQRPSVNVITGLIKANIPARVALRVPSQIDARTIMDTQGAETLLGNGDMLIRLSDAKKPLRIQGAFVGEDEVKKVVHELIATYGRAHLDPTITAGAQNEKNESLAGFLDQEAEDEDDLFPAAKEVVLEAGKASTSLLQRRLRVGYSRAARLMDALENNGVIGPQDGSKPREILIQDEEE